MRIYCKSRSGSSVCLNVYGYYPTVHLLCDCAVTSAGLDELCERVYGPFFLLLPVLTLF
jgi:hypothetical protein